MQRTITKQEWVKMMATVMFVRYLCGLAEKDVFVCRTDEEAKEVFSELVDACSKLPIPNEVESNGTKVIIKREEVKDEKTKTTD